jgi:E-phenylitaconyl-CoA hydratase
MKVVKYETRGEVAYITLDRPEALNAFLPATFDQLLEAKERFRLDPALKVAIISGEGKRAFSAGIDLKSYSARLEEGGTHKSPHPCQMDMAAGPEFCEKPLIAAIRGYCFGEGLHLALACDFRVCASDAIFCLPEVAIGMAQTWLSWQTVRVIGLPAALDLCLLAEKRDAAWALSRQLVSEVTLPGEEMAAAERIALRLCAMGQRGVIASKKTIYRSLETNYRELMAYGLPLRNEVLDAGEDRERSRQFTQKQRAGA